MSGTIRWKIILPLILLLTGCNLQAAPPSPTTTLPAWPTITAVPTVVLPTATVTLLPPTPRPTATPLPTMTPTLLPTGTPTARPSGEVAEGRGGLRIRQDPDAESWVLGNLPEDMTITIVGRTGDNYWLEVETPDGVIGWTWGSYITHAVDLTTIPVTSDVLQPTTPPRVQGPVSSGGNPAAYPDAPPQANHVSNITGTARQIFLRGQEIGNRAAVFSKVGDSLTVATYTLYPFGWRTHNLYDYDYYQPAVDYWSAVIARDGYDSFGNISLAADNGWTSRSILNPNRADHSICQPGETPLACEYRVVKPAVALILVGSNDLASLSGDAYRTNLTRIIEISIERGVVPMLTTIPWRGGYDSAVAQFNQIIRELAVQYDVPLIDYWSAMAPLPNQGLSDDYLHPSWPPGDYSQAAHFSPQNLNYGYTIRNFTAIQALDAIWRGALY